jgi:hypothetical protein
VMHGREKSDPAIVAKKSANAVAQATAEWLEPRSGSRPRAGTEENAYWQSTGRAQDRESVSQALERVRTAAQARAISRLSNASPANIQGGSRMRECRSYGSVRGACGNARPYRD